MKNEVDCLQTLRAKIGKRCDIVLLQVQVSALLIKYIHHFTQSREYSVIFAFLSNTDALLPQRGIELYMSYQCLKLRTPTGSLRIN